MITSKLAILIPSIKGREHLLHRLMQILNPQLEKYRDDVVLLMNTDNREKTIGKKRNELIEAAVALDCTHRAFIDDDDTVTEDYLDLNMPGVYGNYDCNSLLGVYTLNGKKDPNKYLFLHSIRYKKAAETPTLYLRPPNHLNVTKLSLIKDIRYHEKNFGEDMTHAEEVAKLGLLKTEYEITKPFYNYLDRTKINGI